jgi:hypothetical protein
MKQKKHHYVIIDILARGLMKVKVSACELGDPFSIY